MTTTRPTFTDAELAELALPWDLRVDRDYFKSFVREMLDEWTQENLLGHIRAMERRAVIHDDPGCLDTARIAATLLRTRHGIEIEVSDG